MSGETKPIGCCRTSSHNNLRPPHVALDPVSPISCSSLISSGVEEEEEKFEEEKKFEEVESPGEGVGEIQQEEVTPEVPRLLVPISMVSKYCLNLPPLIRLQEEKEHPQEDTRGGDPSASSPIPSGGLVPSFCGLLLLLSEHATMSFSDCLQGLQSMHLMELFSTCFTTPFSFSSFSPLWSFSPTSDREDKLDESGLPVASWMSMIDSLLSDGPCSHQLNKKELLALDESTQHSSVQGCALEKKNPKASSVSLAPFDTPHPYDPACPFPADLTLHDPVHCCIEMTPFQLEKNLVLESFALQRVQEAYEGLAHMACRYGVLPILLEKDFIEIIHRWILVLKIIYETQKENDSTLTTTTTTTTPTSTTIAPIATGGSTTAAAAAAAAGTAGGGFHLGFRPSSLFASHSFYQLFSSTPKTNRAMSNKLRKSTDSNVVSTTTAQTDLPTPTTAPTTNRIFADFNTTTTTNQVDPTTSLVDRLVIPNKHEEDQLILKWKNHQLETYPLHYRTVDLILRSVAAKILSLPVPQLSSLPFDSATTPLTTPYPYPTILEDPTSPTGRANPTISHHTTSSLSQEKRLLASQPPPQRSSLPKNLNRNDKSSSTTTIPFNHTPASNALMFSSFPENSRISLYSIIVQSVYFLYLLHRQRSADHQHQWTLHPTISQDQPFQNSDLIPVTTKSISLDESVSTIRTHQGDSGKGGRHLKHRLTTKKGGHKRGGGGSGTKKVMLIRTSSDQGGTIMQANAVGHDLIGELCWQNIIDNPPTLSVKYKQRLVSTAELEQDSINSTLLWNEQSPKLAPCTDVVADKTTIAWFYVDGIIPTSIVNVISVLNELDLYKAWIPYYSFPMRLGLRESYFLHNSGRSDGIAVFKLDFPWPIHKRECVAAIWSADDLSTKANCITVSLDTCSAREMFQRFRVYIPPAENSCFRIGFNGSIALHPLSATSCRVQYIWKVNPRTTVPSFVLDFITKVFTKSAYNAFKTVCIEAALPTSVYAKRRTENRFLYGFLFQRLCELVASCSFKHLEIGTIAEDDVEENSNETHTPKKKKKQRKLFN